MAELSAELQSLRHSFSFLDVDNMEMQNLMPFDSFFGSSEPEYPGNLEENFQGLLQCVNQNAVPVLVTKNENHEDIKRKATDISEPSSANSTPAVSESGSKTKNVNFIPLASFFYQILHA